MGLFNFQQHRETQTSDPSTSAELVHTVQSLSSARDLQTIMSIVRTAARKITGADGATFVLKDGEFCFYAEEDAIGPLWKGRRFPLKACISGWVMNNKKLAVIPDIYVDPRIPHAAYRTTFVKSLIVVPIRAKDPIGAIGTYWATNRIATENEIESLQALADATSLAMENVQLYQSLQTKIADLEQSNNDLNRFARMASNDFKEPLKNLEKNSDLLKASLGEKLNETQANHLKEITDCASKLTGLTEDLLAYFAALDPRQKKFAKIDLADVIVKAIEKVKKLSKDTNAHITFDEFPDVYGDQNLLSVVFQNLLQNSMKFKGEHNPSISIECGENESEWIISVSDNGKGISPENLNQIFDLAPGMGLTVCKKIVEAHHGKIWIESPMEGGTKVSFSLPKVLFS